MKHKYRVHKGAWERGPWNEEPDFKLWWDDETQYPCVVLRATESGHLNGYVGINWKHPLYRKHDNDKLDAQGKEVRYDSKKAFLELKRDIELFNSGIRSSWRCYIYRMGMEKTPLTVSLVDRF